MWRPSVISFVAAGAASFVESASPPRDVENPPANTGGAAFTPPISRAVVTVRTGERPARLAERPSWRHYATYRHRRR